MLYLAEVQKQKGGLLGGGNKADLKLLACQRNDQSWSSVSEEVIAAEDGSKLSDGALVMVELTPQRQIQRIQEAARPIVTILQNFSRQMEKFKAAEEEIEGWKESLTFQAQEFNRRQEEMEEQMAKFQMMEEEYQQFEVEKQEIESSRGTIDTLKEEIERNRQELEGAWEHLRGEQRRLEELQAASQVGNGLDGEQAAQLSDLVERLAIDTTPTQTVREQINLGLELVERQQSLLTSYWEALAAKRSQLEQQQADMETQEQELRDRHNEWQQAQAALDAQIVEFKANHATLTSREAHAQMLRQQISHQDDLYQQMSALAASSGEALFSDTEVLEALESMPVSELEEKVKSLQEKLEIDSSFVEEQETELTYKQASIDEIIQKINQASDAEVEALETELTDEKDHYQMLHETLVGQRRSLMQRQEELNQHQAILLKRQGKATDTEKENQIDLRPLLIQIEAFRQQQSTDLQEIEVELASLRVSVEAVEGSIEEQMEAQATRQQLLEETKEEFNNLQVAFEQEQSRIHVYEEMLQPIQDTLDELRQSLQASSEILNQVEETSDVQLETVSQMRGMVASLVNS